jgi:DNA-binding MarR family transcriptional regulator
MAGTVTEEGAKKALGLWADLVRVTALIHARVSETLVREAGITPEEVELLLRLSRAPEERLRMVDLSRSLLLSKSGVTRLVDRLEARGLVERAPCPSDRRVVWAHLTPAGRETFLEADPILAAAAAEYLGRHLDEADIAGLRGGVDKLLAAAAGANAPPDGAED